MAVKQMETKVDGSGITTMEVIFPTKEPTVSVSLSTYCNSIWLLLNGLRFIAPEDKNPAGNESVERAVAEESTSKTGIKNETSMRGSANIPGFIEAIWILSSVRNILAAIEKFDCVVNVRSPMLLWIVMLALRAGLAIISCL